MSQTAFKDAQQGTHQGTNSGTKPLLLDSSAWISYYFAESIEIKDILESSQDVLSSILTLFEVERKLRKLRYKEDEITAFLEYIQNRGLVISLDPSICRAASQISIKEKLGALDALILASAKSAHAILVTGDFDFKGMSEVRIIK